MSDERKIFIIVMETVSFKYLLGKIWNTKKSQVILKGLGPKMSTVLKPNYRKCVLKGKY